MPRIMKTTVVDDKVVIVEGPHDSTTSQGTQEAQGIKKRPRFCPRKKKKSTTPKLHLTMNKRKNASVEEEGFEEEAMEKDTASDAKLTHLDTVFFGSVAANEYSIEEEADDVDVVVDSNATTNQMDCAEQVEEEKAKKFCFQNCNKEAVVWPFQKAKRASRKFYGYCKGCNDLRLQTMRVKRKESRGHISEEGARKKLYGWGQEAPVCFQECKEISGYTSDQVKLGFFNRDFLHSFVSAGRMMVGKEGTVAAAKQAWNAISHTSQPGGRPKDSSGLYNLVGDELEAPWEAKVGKMMGLRCDRHTNPHVYTLSYFVQKLKDELGITGEKCLGYKVKFGLVATVADYVQMPHQDCECNENNIHSWIFHVPICARGSYIYIWDVENMHKTLVHIPLGSFLVLREDVWHGGIVGGEGNVRVHGGIFEAWAFQSASKLTYPPANQGESLRNYKRSFDLVHNDQPIDYEEAISMVSENQLEQLEQMHQNICKSFPATTLFYSPLPLGEEN